MVVPTRVRAETMTAARSGEQHASRREEEDFRGCGEVGREVVGRDRYSILSML